jgi:hypothetical protein
MRSDPSDNGGLFVGRRPGTAPIRFRALPQRGSRSRQRIDNALARFLFAAMVIGCLLCWGPIPLACIWVSAQSNYLTGSVSLGFLLAIVALFVLLFLVRRAAGYDQRSGVLPRIFAVTAAVCAAAFSFWFIVIHGPGSSSMPGNKP